MDADTKRPSITVRRFGHPERYAAAHSHPEGQLFVLSAGRCIFRVENEEWLMMPGRPCWVPPGLFHATETGGRSAGVSLFVPADICARLPRAGVVLRPEPLLLALIERLATAGLSEARTGRLLDVLVDEIAAAAADPLRLSWPKTASLRGVAESVAANPADDRSPQVWADEAGVSGRTLMRRFKEETGLTFVEWRRQARIMSSIALLQTDPPLADVARTVGYESASAFISAFREVTGIPPRRFVSEVAALRLAGVADE